jgi:hypothetical protein
MINQALLERIIRAADEYHMIAEDQWSQVIDLTPENGDLDFEFRRLVRAALRYYARAYLVLDMIETVDEQEVEDLLEIVGEQVPEFEEFFQKNDVIASLDEESPVTLSRVFAIAEAVRSLLLERSNQLAASLAGRF